MYSETIWENTPSTNTPINADNLNKMEMGIKSAFNSSIKTNVVPILRNGSRGNPSSANAIAFNEIVEIGEVKTITLEIDIPLITGYVYDIGLFQYSVSSGNPASPSLNPYILTGSDHYLYTKNNIITINLRSDCKGIAMHFLMCLESDHNSFSALRIANTGTNCISIYYSVEVNELKNTLYTSLTREPFAYIGNAGDFIFYNPNVFDGAGRCAWKVNDGIHIKLPNKNTVSFSMAAIVSALPNDTWTDSSSNVWVYLRNGYALVYDDSSASLGVVQISTNTPLGNKIYPLLMCWYGQMVGGLLFNKFAFDQDTNKTIKEAETKYPDVFLKEPFGYIATSGDFVFRNPNVFDGAGRCAWRITSSDLCLKLPNKAVIVVSFSTVISSLTNDDLYTDSDNITWIYLRSGRALVYDYLTSSFKTVNINSTEPIPPNSYPFLMAWYGQMVGGLLYEKFLYDKMLKLLPSNPSSTNSENAKYINNAEHRILSSGNSLSILHFSDIHGDTAALSRINTFLQDNSSIIDDAICTGDMVSNSSGEIDSWWNANIMTCIGNHDSASYDSETGYDWTALSMADRSAYYIEPFESSWGITHDEGKSYYYKDYSTQKVRLIVIDAMLYTGDSTISEAAAQTSWLEGLLADAITNNYHVLIATHAPHSSSTSKECNFSKYGATVDPVRSDCNTPDDITDAVSTAIGNGLNFIGYICGHTHQDNIWDVDNDGKQLFYTVTCAIVSQSAQWAYGDQFRSVTLDAYNIINIDTVNKQVRIVRCGGADLDNLMRSRKGISLSYADGSIIGQS